MKFSIKIIFFVIILFITKEAFSNSQSNSLETVVCHDCNLAGEIEITRRRATEAAQFHYPAPAAGQRVTVNLGFGVLRLEAMPDGNWHYGDISSEGIRNHHNSNIYQSECGPRNSYCDAINPGGGNI